MILPNIKKHRIIILIAIISFSGLILSSCNVFSDLYTVTYDFGYSDKTEEAKVPKGLITPPDEPIRAGYNFDGWYITVNNEETLWDFSTDEVNDNITLKAHWSPISNTITFVPNGGICDTEKITVYYGQPYQLPEIHREGYYFAGWFDGSELQTDSVWMRDRDGFFEAQWTTYPPNMTVKFGSYEQDNDLTNGSEDIEWLVIDYQDGNYLLLSKYILDTRYMEDTPTEKSWKDCSLRKWLQTDFISQAFNETEQKYILSVYLKDTETTDRVFLLNREEAFNLVFSSSDRYGLGTPYALEQGLSVENGNPEIYSWWWLRTSNQKYGSASGYAYGESNSGRSMYGVRPAIWLQEEYLNLD